MAKFLITNNSELQPVNSQFSGIFKISQPVTPNPALSESSNSTTEIEFLTPKTKKAFRLASPYNKELEVPKLAGSELEMVERISRNYRDGQLTIQT